MREQRALPAAATDDSETARPAPPVARAPRARARHPGSAARRRPRRRARDRPSRRSASRSRARAARVRSSLPSGVDACGERRARQSLRRRTSAATHARRSSWHRRVRMRERRERRAPRLRERQLGLPRRPVPRATPAPARRSAAAPRASGSASTIVGGEAPGLSRRRGSGRCRRAAPRASSAARWPRRHSSAPAGAITATFARWRWLVSCDEFDQRADAIDARSCRPLAACPSSGSIVEQLEPHEIRMLRRRSRNGSRRTCRTRGRPARGVSHSSACAKSSASACLPMPRGPWISSACGQRRASREQLARASPAATAGAAATAARRRRVVVAPSVITRQSRAPRGARRALPAPSSSGRVLSMTRKRCGSARARSR